MADDENKVNGAEGAEDTNQEGENTQGKGQEGDAGEKDTKDSGKNAKDGGGLLDDANDDLKEVKFEEGVKPDWLDEALWDEEKKAPKTAETLEALQKAQKQATDLRAKMGKGTQKAPKTADDYKFEPAAELKEMVKEDDPVVKAARGVAHKYGLGQEQFQGFMGDMLGEIAKLTKGMTDAAAAEPTEEEIKAYRQQEAAKLGKNGVAVMRAVTEWGRQLHANGVLSESDIKVLKAMGHSADEVRVLNKLRTISGGQEIPLEMQLDDGLPSDAEIFAMMGTAKYQDGDPETVKKVEKLLDQRRAAGRPERLQVPA